MKPKMTENLPSCPCCEGMAVVIDHEADSDYTVRCFDCGLETRHGPKGVVIDLWSSRASVDRMYKEKIRVMFSDLAGRADTGEGGGETIMIDAPEMRCAECDCEHGGDDCNWIAPTNEKPRPAIKQDGA